MKLFSPKDTLPLFLFPHANHALSCTQPASLFPMRKILMQCCSVALLHVRVFTMIPEVNVSTDPAHHLEMAVCEPAPAL